ncbi:unnamed protein product [Leptidea sinapis]|uniref:Uncharacterized protein n=1 Tax=Leptidea sinapis TaxID=189913 RepID=A0A5E4PPS9_9NEOP|nr:unnamed protein product [Leptidea sinapis]
MYIVYMSAHKRRQQDRGRQYIFKCRFIVVYVIFNYKVKMKLCLIAFGVLVACTMSLALENGPIIGALQPAPKDVVLVESGPANNRQKRFLLGFKEDWSLECELTHMPYLIYVNKRQSYGATTCVNIKFKQKLRITNDNSKREFISPHCRSLINLTNNSLARSLICVEDRHFYLHHNYSVNTRLSKWAKPRVKNFSDVHINDMNRKKVSTSICRALSFVSFDWLKAKLRYAN